MRHLYVQPDLRVRFPGRSEEFNQGVEIGMVALLMSMGQPNFVRWLSAESVDQARQIPVP